MILNSFQNCNLFDSSGGQLICKTPDLPLEISRPGTKMKMVLLLVNDEFHWQMWRFKSVPVYILVYPNPVFERFDTTDKTEVFGSKMQFSIYVRCAFYDKDTILMFNIQRLDACYIN